MNTSSINGFFTWPEHTSYTAAKHAVKGFTESLLAECALKYPQLHVASVHPGGVKTSIAEKAPAPPGISAATHDRMSKLFSEMADLTAEEAATWILNGVKRNSTRILVGYDAHLMDIATRLGPRWSLEIFAALGRSGWRLPLRTDEEPLLPTGSQFMRMFFGGGWYMALMMSPMVLARARRHVSLGPVVGAAALTALAMRQRAKL